MLPLNFRKMHFGRQLFTSSIHRISKHYAHLIETNQTGVRSAMACARLESSVHGIHLTTSQGTSVSSVGRFSVGDDFFFTRAAVDRAGAA